MTTTEREAATARLAAIYYNRIYNSDLEPGDVDELMALPASPSTRRWCQRSPRSMLALKGVKNG